MKLSRAIVVVILMHVVAVGGVLAFSLLHEGTQPLQTESRAREENGKKKESVRKTASTPGLEAPKPAPAAALAVTPAPRASVAADPLESQALAILQGGAPAKPGTAVTTRAGNHPAKLTAKPELRPASTTVARAPKKDDGKQRN